MRVYKVRIALDPEGWGIILEVFPTSWGGRQSARLSLFARPENLKRYLRESFDISSTEANQMIASLEVADFCEKKVPLSDETVVKLWGKPFDPLSRVSRVSNHLYRRPRRFESTAPQLASSQMPGDLIQ